MMAPLIFSWLNWSILYIFQFICYTKKKFGFRSLFFCSFFTLSISSWLSVYPSLFLSVNIWISGIGVCLYFFLSSYLYGVLHFNALLSNICSHFRCADGICGHFFWIHCRLFAIGRSISFYIHWLSLLLHSDVIALDYIINCLSNQPFIKLIPMLAIGIVSRCVYLLMTKYLHWSQRICMSVCICMWIVLVEWWKYTHKLRLFGKIFGSSSGWMDGLARELGMGIGSDFLVLYMKCFNHYQ